jgi:hypothetical protein
MSGRSAFATDAVVHADGIGLGILDRSWLMNNVAFAQHSLELMSDEFGIWNHASCRTWMAQSSPGQVTLTRGCDIFSN